MTAEPHHPPLPYTPPLGGTIPGSVPLPGLEPASDDDAPVRASRPARGPAERAALADAWAAADRVERFLAARARMTLLDPHEVTGVYVGEQLLVLQRADLQTLVGFVGARLVAGA